MAKTIKEMAHEHVVAYMHNDEYEEMEDTYIAGANAVLEEIEECLNDRYAITSFYRVKDKIKELKEL